MYCFVRYLDGGETKKRWLVFACLSYFMVCQNYWMYYVSTYLLLLGLAYQKRRLNLRKIAVLSVPPVVAFVLVVGQVMHARGGFHEGYYYLAKLGAVRTVDARLPGKRLFKKDSYVKESDVRSYPQIVARRISTNMGVDFSVLAAMLAASVALSGGAASRRYRWLLFGVPAGMSWNLFMIQHTIVHAFSGMFGYFLWMLGVGAFFEEIYRKLKPERAKLAITVILVPVTLGLLQHTYLPRMSAYLKNIAAGEVVEVPSAQKKRR
jgi:hypothetical protein